MTSTPARRRCTADPRRRQAGLDRVRLAADRVLGPQAGMTWSLSDTGQSIPERFANQVRRMPAKPALGGTDWRPTMSELDAAANRLGVAMLERRGGEGGRVALLLRHDAPVFAAALGALKAGKTVVALNPTDPAARLERIRADAEPELVLTDARHRELALRAGFSAGEILMVAARPDCSPHSEPGVKVSPDEVAFLIYTSGATGRPKGVMQTHRNLLHNVLRHTNGLGLRADDRIALVASLSGGQGVATTCTALLNGATLCPFPIMERGMTGLAGWLTDNGVTVFVASASVFRHFVRTLDGRRLSGVRLLRLASEPAVHADFQAFRRHFADSCMLASTLSSSEAGPITQCLLGADVSITSDRLPVGRPAEGIEVLLLDDHGAEVAPGQTGEIVIGSDYLSPGYWRDDALTAERFVRDRSNGDRRLFHSGDLGRLSVDGLLTVVGRKDTQIKVRGNRVELSEVEAALAAQPEVSAAAVLPATTPRGDMRMTAYLSSRPGHGLTSERVRRSLRGNLPDHAVPAAFVFLEALPLNPQGKIDRGRLAEIEAPAPQPDAADSAVGETEELLAEVWSRAFELEQVGRDDDFFDLGGDSLTAAVIAAELHAAFGVELELGAFVEEPTVAAMGRLVDRMRADGAGDGRPPLVAAPRTVPPPASLAQERTWRACRTEEASVGHSVAIPLRIQGRLDPVALRQAVDSVVRRHEVLRTTFTERDGAVVQIVHPPRTVDLPLIDLRGDPDAEARVADLVAQESATPFDLERGPLLRLRLVRIGQDEHRLLRTNHHIISDGWSWRVFFGDLASFYVAYTRGEPPPPLPELALQYGDFATWERRRLSPDAARYREEVAWWRERLPARSPPIDLPFARSEPRPRRWWRRSAQPPALSPSDGIYWWGLRPEVSRGLEKLGREAGATFYMVRLAAFAAQLAIETGRDEIVLGGYVTNRRLAELQSMFGPFYNQTNLVLRFPGNPTFRRWLEQVRGVVVETSAHAEIPFGRLSEELDSAGAAPPAIEVMFHMSEQMPPLRFGGLELTPMKANLQAMPWGFTFLVDRCYEADRCRASFDARIHDPAAVRAFIDRYRRLAAELCAYPDRPLREMVAGL